jgi:hypothetical protein
MRRLNMTSLLSLVLCVTASTALSATIFSNSSPISIPATTGGVTLPVTSDPYPSQITVSGMAGTLTDISVILNGWTDRGTSANPGSLFFLLTGPSGLAYDFLGDSGSNNSFTDITLTLTDTATTHLTTGMITSGSFKPTVLGTSCPAFPAPAPASGIECAIPRGTTTFTSLFTGSQPNGAWSLYIFDNTTGDTASTIDRGWSLAIDSTGGFMLPETPEPSSLTLVGLAMGLFVFRRRRNRS